MMEIEDHDHVLPAAGEIARAGDFLRRLPRCIDCQLALEVDPSPAGRLIVLARDAALADDLAGAHPDIDELLRFASANWMDPAQFEALVEGGVETSSTDEVSGLAGVRSVQVAVHLAHCDVCRVLVSEARIDELASRDREAAAIIGERVRQRLRVPSGIIHRADRLPDAVRLAPPSAHDDDEQPRAIPDTAGRADAGSDSDVIVRRFPVGSSVCLARLTREGDVVIAEFASWVGMDPIGFIVTQAGAGGPSWIPRASLEDLRANEGHWRSSVPCAEGGGVVEGAFVYVDDRHATSVEGAIRAVLSRESDLEPMDLVDFYNAVTKRVSARVWGLAITCDPADRQEGPTAVQAPRGGPIPRLATDPDAC